MNRVNNQFEYYSQIEAKPIEWLWYPYIPYGKITLLQGDPGEGKSTFMLNIAALLSKGKPFPDGSIPESPQTVIYQCSEDDAADTIKPRLVAAGADCNKVAYILDDCDPLTMEDKRIEETIRETGARLLVLDPIQSFMNQDGDMHRAVRVRAILGKLSKTAAKYGCAVVLVGHMTKMSGSKSLYRGLGSIDIAAIARSILMIERDRECSNIRYMYPIKSSLALEGKAIAFSFDKDSGFQWFGPAEYSGESETIDDESKGDIVRRILIEILCDKDAPSATILNQLAAEGISARTIYSVKKELKIVSYKKENGIWYWHLPSIEETPRNKNNRGSE